MFPIAIWAIIGGVVGARFFHVISEWHFYSHNLGNIFHIWSGGLAMWGAIVGATVAGIISAKAGRLPLGKVLNFGAPGAALAQAVGRVGCFINGDAYGTPTSLPWGVAYTHPNHAESTQTYPYVGHPFPIYEIIWDLLIFVTLLKFRKKFQGNYQLFLLYISMYAGGRFFLSFLRGGEEVFALGLHFSQIICVVAFIIAVPLFVFSQKQGKFVKTINGDTPTD
jgi:phosphatidylglycerol:prolipoprotein diacylglycerol transferase